MRAVWKYHLEIVGPTTLHMPGGGKVVHVAMQRGCVCLWAEVEPTVWQQERTFVIRGTGHALEKGMQHVGSTIDDPFVWHVYEVAGAANEVAASGGDAVDAFEVEPPQQPTDRAYCPNCRRVIDWTRSICSCGYATEGLQPTEDGG